MHSDLKNLSIEIIALLISESAGINLKDTVVLQCFKRLRSNSGSVAPISVPRLLNKLTVHNSGHFK